MERSEIKSGVNEINGTSYYCLPGAIEGDCFELNEKSPEGDKISFISDPELNEIIFSGRAYERNVFNRDVRRQASKAPVTTADLTSVKSSKSQGPSVGEAVGTVIVVGAIAYVCWPVAVALVLASCALPAPSFKDGGADAHSDVTPIGDGRKTDGSNGDMNLDGGVDGPKDSGDMEVDGDGPVDVKVDQDAVSDMTPDMNTPPTPIVEIKFNEGEGTSASDSSGLGHNGTLENGAGWSAGLEGNAVSLDGSGAFVSVPNASDLDFGTDNFAVCISGKPNSTGTIQTWLDLGTSETRFLQIYQNTSGNIEVAGTNCPNIVGDAVVAGAWSTVCFVKQAGQGALYQDGVNTASGACNESYSSGTSLAVGCNLPARTCTEEADASFDLLRVYRGAVPTEDQINQQMTCDMTPSDPSCTQ